MNIRKATNQDYRAFVELNMEIQTLHSGAEPTFFKPVGYVLSEIWHTKETPLLYAMSGVYIRHLLTKQNERGNGYGKQLLASALEFAKENGISKVELDTWSFNADAMEFFKKNGFKTIKERMTVTVG